MDNVPQKPPLGQAQLTVSETLLRDAQPDPTSIAIKQGVSEFGGTLSAGIAGTAAFSLLPKRYSIPVKLVAAAVSGGVTKFGVKGGLETAMLSEEHRTTSAKDLAWGALDGLAGVGASAMEQYAARKLTTNLGFKYVGNTVTSEAALSVGEKVLQGSITQRIKQNTIKGLSAGFVGSTIYSVPHSIANNADKLNTTEGLVATGKEITLNVGLGTLFGGVLAGGITTAANGREIFRHARAAVQGDKGVSRVDILHFNDMHSALIGERASLPQLATKADELRAASQAKGRQALLFDLGDNYSGNVIAGSTDVGYVETAAIQKMKVDGFIPGNHVADIGFGKTDVDSWVRNMNRLRSEAGKDLPAIASNIDVPSYPGFIGRDGVYKPYRVIETAQGEKVGMIGLVTRELEIGSDKAVVYNNALETANKTIAELNKQGVNKVIVLSHMGRAEDIALASQLKGKVAAIVGAHSHDMEPLPIWIRNAANGNDIPIVQAGSKAGWLGELNLAFKPDGTADKYRTLGRLHEIHEGVKPHPEIKQFIHEQTSHIAGQNPGTYRIADLSAQTYHDVRVHKPFSADGIRGEAGVQTPLGTVISRGLLEEVNVRLPEINAARAAAGLKPLEPMSIMLKHTGDIREELPVGVLNRLTASNVFLNTGSAQREASELAAMQLTGHQLKRALEFSVHDLAPAPQIAGGSTANRIGQRLKALVVEPKFSDLHDYTGNFLMGEGIKYSYNRALPAGQRVLDVHVYDAATKGFVPVDPNKTYNILSLFHPVDKWGKVGMITTYENQAAYNTPANWVFGQRLGSDAARGMVSAEPIPLSQVDLMVSYLQRQKGALTPSRFGSSAISDLTPTPWAPPVMLGRYSIPSMAATSGFDTYIQAQKQGR